MNIAERIGVSTHFLPAVNNEDIFEAIDKIKDAGFNSFEIVPTKERKSVV